MSVQLSSRGRVASGATSRDALAILCLVAFCVIGLTLILTSAYPSEFDELEHVSYAAFLQETGRLLPKFELQRTLAVGNMLRWDDRPNYLGHPSPFYLYISLFLDRALPVARAILMPRLASGAQVLGGVILSILAARRLFRADALALPVFCLTLALCPKLLAVTGQVTNDALGFLGGALAYWGASTLDRRRWQGLGGIALGVVFALWAKPNAGLLVCGWLGVFALLRRPRGLALFGTLAGATMVGAIPYLFILRDYGALVPVTVEQFGHVRQLADFRAYLPAFLLTVGYTWSFAQTGTWPMTQAGSFLASGLFWLMIASAFAGGALACRRGWAPRDAIAAAAPAAFAMVLPIHLWFSATHLGFSLPAASFRYYLPLWPAMAHTLAYGTAVSSPRRGLVLASVTIAALGVGWLSL
jgi:hypothetical protein